ncbi:MAG: hypothetical protein DGJ47_000354 [Rickettsiaceae bacterium]
MSDGKTDVNPTIYRDRHNIIKDTGTSTIVYMPPESKDVFCLMRNLVSRIKENKDLPCSIVADIAHYQFATIHPYYDGNGRTARLLTTLILHLGGYTSMLRIYLVSSHALTQHYVKNGLKVNF